MIKGTTTMRRTIIIGLLAVVVTVLAALAIGAAVGIGGATDEPLDAQQRCRVEARAVFDDVLAERIDQAEGQRRVDEACAGVDATAREAIITAERNAALARATVTP